MKNGFMSSVKVLALVGALLPGAAMAELLLSDKAAVFDANAKQQLLTKNTADRADALSAGSKSSAVSFFISEDVNPDARLAITGPNTVLLSSPIEFHVLSNYADFISGWRLNIYDADDKKRHRPRATIAGKGLTSRIEWDGSVSSGKPLKAGDELVYEFQVEGTKYGVMDSTHLKPLTVVATRSAKEQQIVDEAKARNNWYESLVNQNDLKESNIPVQGSLLTITGQGLSPNEAVTIEGVQYLADAQGRLTVRLHKGVGDYAIKVESSSGRKTLSGKVSSSYFFLAALADITLGKGTAKSAANKTIVDANNHEHFDKNLYVDGRLAYYLKGKVKGKYLITAQMDSNEARFSDMIKGLDHRDNTKSLLQRIDPDKYYPVYGDGSTIKNDVDTQGKFYVRVDWDHSQFIAGNYNTNLTGTELAQYNRTLYGGKLDYRSNQVTKLGDKKVQVTAFAAQATSQAARDELAGTGGSLYYLKHQDVVLGSEKVRVRIRDKETGLTCEKDTVLTPGRDYQFNAVQGRLTLSNPLSSYANCNASIIASDLQSDEITLVVDYEYAADDLFDDKNVNLGLRAKTWLSDHIGVGVTQLNEENGDTDYSKKAVDMTLKYSNGTYVRAEFAKSENAQMIDAHRSDNGGLRYTGIESKSNTVASGSAKHISARVDLQDVSKLKGSASAWFREQTQGYETDHSSEANQALEQVGVDAQVELSDKVSVRSRHVQTEKSQSSEESTSQLEVRTKVTDKLDVGAEIRSDRDEMFATGVKRKKEYLGLKAEYKLSDQTRLYAKAQQQVNDEFTSSTSTVTGADEDSTQYTVGVESRANQYVKYNAEVSEGDLGSRVRAGVNVSPVVGHDVYAHVDFEDSRMGSYTGERGQKVTVGNKSQVTNKLNVYQEYQFDKVRNALGSRGEEASQDKVWGYMYKVNSGWSVGGSYEKGDVERTVDGSTSKIDRTAGSMSVHYKEGNTQVSSRFEARKDKDANTKKTELTQVLFSSRMRHVKNDELTYLGRFEIARTKNLSADEVANYIDGQVGVAYRPKSNDKLNLLSMYRYIENNSPDSQTVDADTKSHIGSVDWVYEVTPRVEMGGKLAFKKEMLDVSAQDDTQVKGDQTLGALRVRVKLVKGLDAMAEYRRRKVGNNQNSTIDNGVMQGGVAEVGYGFNKHLRGAVGYNFTQFSDDLSDDDLDREGWFVNLVGKY